MLTSGKLSGLRNVISLGFFIGFLAISLCVSASEKSNSMLFNQDKTYIYSANFDAGSVSIIERETGRRIKQRMIGRDIRRLALSFDGKRILASDYLGDKLVLLNASTLELIREIKTPSRPFAVIFDKKNNQFYATSFEQDKLLVVSVNGDIIHQLETEKTPRGLALTDDGRLLVTHALTGQVSIYDVNSPTPKLIKVL